MQENVKKGKHIGDEEVDREEVKEMMNGDWREINCDWVPLISLGDFKFGASIDHYVQEGLVFYKIDEPDGTGWDGYTTLDPSVSIDSEDGRIISITCDERCIYNKINLIGKTIPELVQILKCNPSPFVDTMELYYGTEKIYKFDDVNAQVWVKFGKVYSMVLGGEEED